MDSKFWARLEDLVKSSEIVIDRPKGSAHPRYPEFFYPLDYGYLKGTSAIDGNGVDCWMGKAEIRELTAIVCTVDIVKRDTEVKLIIGCTDEEIEIIRRVHNGPYQSGIVIKREDY